MFDWRVDQNDCMGAGEDRCMIDFGAYYPDIYRKTGTRDLNVY